MDDDDDELRSRAQGRVGTVLCGKYRIDRVLGVGGMAVVYAATHRNQKRVAVKMLHPELSMHKDVRARFLREGYAANTSTTPAPSPSSTTTWPRTGRPSWSWSCSTGEAVEDLWERQGGRLAAREVLAIGRPAARRPRRRRTPRRSSTATSSRRTSSSPATGSLKVLDFGIARVRDAASKAATATKTGIAAGDAGVHGARAGARQVDGDRRGDRRVVGRGDAVRAPLRAARARRGVGDGGPASRRPRSRPARWRSSRPTWTRASSPSWTARSPSTRPSGGPPRRRCATPCATPTSRCSAPRWARSRSSTSSWRLRAPSRPPRSSGSRRLRFRRSPRPPRLRLP